MMRLICLLGRNAAIHDMGRIAHFPIAYQAGSTQPPIFEPPPGNAAGSPVAMLLADMNAYLDSMGLTTRVSGAPSKGTPPDVRFSCETPPAGPDDECAPGSRRSRHQSPCCN